MNKKNDASPKTLAEEALLLLTDTAEMSAAERKSRQQLWQNQSTDHRTAFAQAQSEWGLFATASAKPMGAIEATNLGLQVALASALDHPFRAASAASVIAALMLWGAIGGQGPVQSVSAPVVQAHLRSDAHKASFGNDAQRYTTHRGEQQEIKFSDGSTIWLNWNTEVLVLDNPTEIHVDVQIGDVLFSVAQGSKKPLVVHAGQSFAYAADTEFAIHSHGPDDAFFQVKKGVITIASSNKNSAIELAATQQTYYSKGVGVALGETDLDTIATWREGKLVFDNRPLAETLWELAHFTERPMIVGAIANAQVDITATYALGEADAAVTQLADAYGLELISGVGDTIVIRSIDARR